VRIPVISFCVATAVALAIARPALAGAGPSVRRSGPQPALSRKEAVLLREVAELAKTDRAAAVARLREAVTDKSSARLDFALAVLLHNDTPGGPGSRGAGPWMRPRPSARL